MMGGFDGFSLSKNAPAQAWQFLEFLLTTPQQEAYAKANVTIPINPAAQGVVTDPSGWLLFGSYVPPWEPTCNFGGTTSVVSAGWPSWAAGTSAVR